VDVAVESADLERKVERSAKALGRQLRIPGFRAGKVPPAIVLQRVGRDAVLEQTVRDSLGEWYERAVVDSGVRPIGDPKLDLQDLPAEGQPLEFSFEVAVRPPAKLGRYRGLEAGRRVPEVPPEQVDAELDRLREGFASLDPVDRAPATGDFLLIDFQGRVDGEPFEGGEARDYLLELGADQLIEGFAEQLEGAAAGEEREVKVTFPADYRADELAGKEASFAVTVKEVREKRLPELDDEFAADASEFDTLEELKADLGSKLGQLVERQIEDEFREAVLDAAVDEATVEVPAEIAKARAEQMWERLEHSLGHRGIDPDRYLEVSGKTREQVIDEAKPDAERALRREAVLLAVAEAESIEVAEDELLEELAPAAGRQDTKPEKLLQRLRSSGQDAVLRDELRLRKALDLMVSEAKPIPLEQAAARDKLWTPEKEREAGGSAPGLWTPGDGD
jgi:trigger factor